ncbi:T9SS type A sorting domain-containing protein [Owenweeksia hongkongensis]|uniref:DUF7619 domain-containing protein n=1 Tax=Owenweeksia hongkongensis TaxID=253245 RepID=UPI003A94BC2F
MKTRQIITGFLVLIIAFIETINAQVFQRMGNGLGTSTFNMQPYGSGIHEFNGKVYVFRAEYGSNGIAGIVQKWDGFSWTNFPNLVGGPNEYIQTIIEYQNEVYIGTADWQAGGGLYKLSGGSWQNVFSNLNGNIFDLEINNGTLYFGGSFTMGTSAQHSIAAYDGTSLVSVPAMGTGDTIHDIASINGELWVGGHFQEIGNTSDSLCVKKLTNSSSWEWQALMPPSSNYYDRSVQHVFSFNNKIHTLGWSKFYEVNNSNAQKITVPMSVSDYTEHDGMLYLINPYQNSTNNAIVHTYDGTNFYQVTGFPKSMLGVTSGNSHLYALFGQANFKINGTDAGHVLKMGNLNLGLLSGKVYLDENTNCTFDLGIDRTAPAMTLPIQANGTIMLASTNGLGDYSIYLPAGTYPLQPPVKALPLVNYYIPGCNTPSSITIQANQNQQQDFVFVHDGTKDIESEIYTWLGNRSRHGFTEIGHVVLRNPGIALTGPVSVKVTLPPTVSFQSSTPTPTSISGNEYTYTYQGMGQATQEIITFSAKINLGTNAIGDTLKWYSEVVPVSGDIDMSNDKDTTCTTVVAACDPNDKTPSVEQSLPGLSRLDYHIRFQNTGTDTAYSVTIVDTLESYFDPASIMINGASHDYSFHISDNNVIAWTFDNILLPDSGANYAGSQGFVNFSIDVDPTLNVGDIIDNDAEIYFDFQPAVHTNHAKTAIVSVLGVEEFLERQTSLEVYPNPARGMFYIENSLNEEQEVKLIDATGKVIRNISLQPEMMAEVGTYGLAPGIYFINNGSNTHRVIITP